MRSEHVTQSDGAVVQKSSIRKLPKLAQAALSQREYASTASRCDKI